MRKLLPKVLIAGANAALSVKKREPLILERSEAYIGVMIDDLVTREVQNHIECLLLELNTD